MVPFLSLVTSMKDYIEVVHKLLETDAHFSLSSYSDFGSVFTFFVLTGKEFFQNILSFHWFKNFWSLPTLVPDIASSLLSEISVFDGSFQTAQTFLESPFSYGNQNFLILCLEKFMIGFLNSLFLCFPTSVSHLITLRQFVMQGVEAGFLSGLGTLVGNIVWIGSILFGFRWIVIPWLSLDLFRYFLGFLFLVKYMWESSRERRMVLEDFSKYKIFFFTFFLSFTEQTTLYPFVSTLSFGSDATILETFPAESFAHFSVVHLSYLFGLFLGSFSFLQCTCWFWENPAFQIYMWFVSSFQITKTFSSKFLNFIFLYLTMICAISNFSYFGLDYTLTNPFGFVHEDRFFEQKAFLETAFLNTKASDRNTRRNRGRHGRRERWKRRVRRYRTFDASLYDQGVYDLFTLEDLNYGFDRFWLRRKIRNHRVRFRFFPGPWMRSFKKQLSRPRLESFLGPRVEFFRILFEQAYHPEFHEFSAKKNLVQTKPHSLLFSQNGGVWDFQKTKKQKLLKEHATLRKFARKVQTRIKKAEIEDALQSPQNFQRSFENAQRKTTPISSKMWKMISGNENRTFSEPPLSKNGRHMASSFNSDESFFFDRFSKKLFSTHFEKNTAFSFFSKDKNSFQKHFSKKERFLQRYKAFLYSGGTSSQNGGVPSKKKNSSLPLNSKNPIFFSSSSASKYPLLSEETSSDLLNTQNTHHPSHPSQTLDTRHQASQYRAMTLLHPFQFYFQKEQAFQRKCQFYGVKLFRNFGVENNAPYFRVFLKRFFYHFKPSLRWERTLRVATYRRARRKTSRIPRKFNVSKNSQIFAQHSSAAAFETVTPEKSDPITERSSFHPAGDSNQSGLTPPTHFYSLVEKRASRYRFQIYKDVLQHWYYSPLNRLLVKLDVDAFLRRQPNSYFLTKNDEKFLHLKRQLLSEYSETLRWYTSMEHYRTMKAHIGGTKSLSNRAYLQQFAGTFQKIRHLFTLSPSFRESSVLQFDQPLYNEYQNSGSTSLFKDSVLHEELFSENFSFFPHSSESGNRTSGQSDEISSSPQNLANQSLRILREYLSTSAPLRQQYIDHLFNEQKYWELTQFFFRGQKIRGDLPLANETDLLNQEKNALFPSEDETQKDSRVYLSDTRFSLLKDEKWIALLKKCQKKLYDQEALKNYVSLKKEKYEMQKQRHEKYLQKRFERIKESVLHHPELFQDISTKNTKSLQTALSYSEKRKIENFENFSGSPSSLKKALKESLLWESNSKASSSFQTLDTFFGADGFSQRGKKFVFDKTNIRNTQFPLYSLFDKNSEGVKKTEDVVLSPTPNFQTFHSHVFAKNLRFSLKKQALVLLQAERNLQEKFTQSPHSWWKEAPHSSIRALFTLPKNLRSLFKRNEKKKDEADAKDFLFWKKRETLLSKRKKLRKTLKRLRNQQTPTDRIVFENSDFFMPLSSHSLPGTENRQKNDTADTEFLKNQKKTHARSWRNYMTSSGPKSEEKKGSSETQKPFFSFFRRGGQSFSLNPFETLFQRKRSRLRRYSSFKGRGPIKKRTLREKFKRQFKSLKKYGKTQKTLAAEEISADREKKKVDLIQVITERRYEPDGKFVPRDEKQRRTRQSKHRVWKKKKQNFAQKRRKLRKRRRSTVSKIRVFTKKLSRLLSRKELQKWWWKTFFPHFQSSTEKTWRLQKTMQIQKQFSELSEKDIFERDAKNLTIFSELEGKGLHTLSSVQIGNKDFKPFAIPEAARIREKLVEQNGLRFQKSFGKTEVFQNTDQRRNRLSGSAKTSHAENVHDETRSSENSNPIFEAVNRSLFQILPENPDKLSRGSVFSPLNPLPFYAGWDESRRTFVLTNRYLSRKESFSLPSNGNGMRDTRPFSNLSRHESSHKTNSLLSPLQGMNAATTLYWQIPFTTYDPDQFFALGMDGFSPIGWRNFSFTHSKQTTKPILVKNIGAFEENATTFSKTLQFKMYRQGFSNPFSPHQKKEIEKNFEYRRILKKQKRLKKHPRPPVWFPSGSLSQQVLPVHYISVFYKRSRFPRDRYIRRRFRGSFEKNQARENSLFADRTSMIDFTLRKRTKPRRKYHRNRFDNLSEKNIFFARRRQFRGFSEDAECLRPSSKLFQSGAVFRPGEKRILQRSESKQRRKIQDSKGQPENLRLRQLRRRVQRQVYRPVWRSRPRAGGFVWPGDYLRLEFVKAPPLQSPQVLQTFPEKDAKTDVQSAQKKTSSRKIRKKQRRTLQEWQIQPKRYLFEKHNLHVFKTRLEKSMSGTTSPR
jgi:hypothetical protein